MEKSCSCCGESFECTSDYGCWCNDVSLTPEQRRKIEDRYDNCLCPRCLGMVSQENNTISSI